MEPLVTLLAWTVHPVITCIVVVTVALILLFPEQASAFQVKVPVVVQGLFLLALFRQAYLIPKMWESASTWNLTAHFFFNLLPIYYVLVFCVLLGFEVLRVSHKVSCRLVFLASLYVTPWFVSYSLSLINQGSH